MADITVYLCKCFGEIAATVDLEIVRAGLGDNPSVSSAEIVDSLCLNRDLETMAHQIREGVTQKVLIAACSSLARGDRIVRGLVHRGVRRTDIHLVDIREGCAWIHAGDPDGATGKAERLIDMGLAHLENVQTSDDVSVKINNEVMVIGAGPAGLAAATSLARSGITVHVIERAPHPGGMLRLVSRLYPKDSAASSRLEPYLDELERNPLITVYPRAKLQSIRGYTGNYKIRLSSGDDEHNLSPGAVIIASGAKVLLPDGLFRYGEVANVISQMELETRFRKGAVATKNAVFIQCVGARCQDRPYCSTICCPASIKNAARLKAENPVANVFVIHRDIMMPGSVLEGYYRHVMAQGVRFIRCEKDRPPEIIGTDRIEAVSVYDAVTGSTRTIDADLAVLSTPLIPNDDNRRIAELLGLQLDRYGFFREIYPMHPVETRMDGVFICGSARWPVSSDVAITQGEAAAMKAAALLARSQAAASDFSRVPGRKFGHARVNVETCSGCGNCMAVCPFDAIRLQKVEGKYSHVSRVNKMRCKACGNCVSVCPNGTMQMPEHNYLSVGEMIRRAF